MPENITITVDDTTEDVTLFVAAGGGVDSVFGRAGSVVAVAGDYDTDEVTEATNLYYTEARVSANTDVAANTAKTGITAQQATDITTNNAKVTFPEAPNDGTQYARKSLGWEAVAGGGDYADGGEAGGANRTLGNTDSFSFGLLTNNLERVQIEADGKVAVVNTQAATNAEETGFKVTPTINQSGTAAYNGIKVDATETATGDGSTGDGNNLLNLAVGGVSKFRIANNGDIVLDDKSRFYYNNTTKRLGIGASTPLAPLEVGQNNGNSYMRVGGDSLTSGIFFKVFRNLSSSVTNAEVARIEQGSAGDDQPLLVLKQDGSGDILQVFDDAVKVFNIADGGQVNSSGTPAYADEAAAVTAGLATGDIYQTTGTAASPLNVAGILMIKQ